MNRETILLNFETDIILLLDDINVINNIFSEHKRNKDDNKQKPTVAESIIKLINKLNNE